MRSSMKLTRRGLRSSVVVLPFLLAACPGSEGPRMPRAGDSAALGKAATRALEVESTKPAAEALQAWLDVLAEAREVVGTPLAREAALAAIDALSGREVVGLEPLGNDTGLMHRVADGPAKVIQALDDVLTSPGAMDPMIRAYAADARMRVAAAKGDAAAYANAQKASGCVTEATVIGPFAGPVLGPLLDLGPVDGGNILPTYPKANPLALEPKVLKTFGRGCSLDPTGSAKAGGLRYVVFDVDVPDAQTIKVGVDTKVPAQILVAGKRAAYLPYGEVLERTTRFGTAEITAPGTVRVVVKLAAWSTDSISLYAMGQDGTPLATHAAAVGAPPQAAVGKVAPENRSPVPSTVEGRITWALGAIAMGDVRLAEGPIAEIVRGGLGGLSGADAKAKPHPGAALVYVRALEHARDIPVHRRLERQRAAVEAVLAAWPSSWEAIVAHAQIVALQRRGGAGEVDAIADARTRRDKEKDVDPLVDAYLALAGDGIYGVREDSLARVMPKLKGTWLGWRLGRVTAKESDDVTAKLECDPARFDVATFHCSSARWAVGDHKGVLAEIARLRTLLAAPKLGAEWEITATTKASGLAAARVVYEKSDIGDRGVRTAVAVAPPGAPGLEWLRRELRPIEGDARSFLDAVNGRRATGEANVPPHPATAFATQAKTAIGDDRKKPARPDAGTLVLLREEKYEMSADGFLHATVFDVRRLAGTQDVESNATAGVAMTSGGNGWMSRAVHRIHKADGTTVEPDRIAAAQAGAELSQIEPGDYVELVAEGWFMPRADGTFDLDTPDLLPGRTAVASATVTLSWPKSVPVEIWSHKELGTANTTESGDAKTMVFTVKDHDVRRAEKGQAGIDREVAIRLGTWGWSRLGREARESALADEERLPEVSAWIAEAVGNDKAPTVDLLVRLSKASKKAIPRVGLLPLGLGGLQTVQNYTARTVLLDNQGSRVALVHRALDELGVKNEIVFAESAPYSADPKMVARPWRFSSPPHAILVAWASEKPGLEAKPWWIDLDVDGMPPPPGRVSPELRGRSAINTRGEIIPVPPNAAEEPDAATIELVVDETGKAKGTIALLYRGRDAQDLSMILEELAGEEREDTLRGFVLAWMPQADVLELKASAETWQVVLTAKVEVPALLIPDGSRYAIAGTPPIHSGARSNTLGATYAAQAKRTTALTIRETVEYTIHRVIKLPAGVAISTPLPAVDVKEPGTSMAASRKVKVDGTTLIEDFAFSLPTGVVAPTAFEAFTKIAREVDDGFQSVVRVQPPPGMAIAGSKSSPKVPAGAKPIPGPKPAVPPTAKPPKPVK